MNLYIERSSFKSTNYQYISASMFFTTEVSSVITPGAVNPLPYFSKAALVAKRTILDARAGPYS